MGPIFIDNITLKELIHKTHLDLTHPPPSAQQIFELYFKDDIYPYIRQNIQSLIRNKRDITKLWDLQSTALQKIYIERAKMLKNEWLDRTKRAKKNGLSGNDEEAARKKAEFKKKNKQKQKKWKDHIAEQIAMGIFEDDKLSKNTNPKRKDNKNKNINSKKKENHKKEQQKKSKSSKKKKLKKWKDKKV